MTSKINDTEHKILNCAYRVFLMYGYHATSLQQIASEVKVNQSTIHYYFRNKESLYGLVLEHLVETIIDNKTDEIELLGINKIRWFFKTEQYNNKELFEIKIEKMYPNDWENIIVQLYKSFE